MSSWSFSSPLPKFIRDHDVVFLNDDSSTDPTTDHNKTNLETTGNRVYKNLLLEYYDHYFCGSPSGLPLSRLMRQHQLCRRKEFLQDFSKKISEHLETIDSNNTTNDDTTSGNTNETTTQSQPNSPNSPTATKSPLKTSSQAVSESNNNSSPLSASTPTKSQFYELKKQGDGVLFERIMFKGKIDEKIKESFERLRCAREGGEKPAVVANDEPEKQQQQASAAATEPSECGEKSKAKSNDNRLKAISAASVGNKETTTGENGETIAKNQNDDSAPKSSTERSQKKTTNFTMQSFPLPRLRKPQETVAKIQNQSNSKETAFLASKLSKLEVENQRKDSGESIAIQPPKEGTDRVVPDPVAELEKNPKAGGGNEDSTRLEANNASSTANSKALLQVAGCETAEDGQHTNNDNSSGGNYYEALQGDESLAASSDIDRSSRLRSKQIYGSLPNIEEHVTAETPALPKEIPILAPKANTTETNVDGDGEDSSSGVSNYHEAIQDESFDKTNEAKKRSRDDVEENTDPNNAEDTKKRTRVEDDPQNITSPFPNRSKWGKFRETLARWRVSFPSPTFNQKPLEEKTSFRRDGLLYMEKILVSPYEGKNSAEVDEEPLERWKAFMTPTTETTASKSSGRGDTDNTKNTDIVVSKDHMNPILSKLYGDPLAFTIFQAKAEIAKSDSLFETSWKYGKIGKQNFGWIPKRALLLCLCEEKIGWQLPPPPKSSSPRNNNDSKIDDDKDDNGNDSSEDTDDKDDTSDGEEIDEDEDETEALQKVTRKLEVFELIIACVREWKLKYEFPELYSNKDEHEFLFKSNNKSTNETSDEEDNDQSNSESTSEENKSGVRSEHTMTEHTRRKCYKCQIFVARVFATLLLFNEEKSEISPSLLAKVKACLKVLNEHVEPYRVTLVKLLKKKKKMEDTALKEAATKKVAAQLGISSDKKRKRLFLGDTPEEREASLNAVFAQIQAQGEKTMKMMDFIESRLFGTNKHNSSFHPSMMGEHNAEIASNLKEQLAILQRHRKKVAKRKHRKRSSKSSSRRNGN